MIRVVLDTNVVVSALLQPLGPSARILLLALGGAIQICVTGAVFAEYEEVLRRPRFRLTAKAHWVRPTQPVRACTDADDDCFLECCQAGAATYLVTGNVKHFPASWLETEIVTPRRFLDLVNRS